MAWHPEAHPSTDPPTCMWYVVSNKKQFKATRPMGPRNNPRRSGISIA